MKKIIVLIMTFLVALSLFSCEKEATNGTTANTDAAVVTTEDTTEVTAEVTDEVTTEDTAEVNDEVTEAEDTESAETTEVTE